MNPLLIGGIALLGVLLGVALMILGRKWFGDIRVDVYESRRDEEMGRPSDSYRMR